MRKSKNIVLDATYPANHFFELVQSGKRYFKLLFFYIYIFIFSDSVLWYSNDCMHTFTVCIRMYACTVKKVGFYIAQYPVRSLFLSWQTCSFRHQLGFSWKHSSHAAIAQRLFTHMSTTVYSQVLIYTAESTEASWRERKCPNFKTYCMKFIMNKIFFMCTHM